MKMTQEELEKDDNYKVSFVDNYQPNEGEIGSLEEPGKLDNNSLYVHNVERNDLNEYLTNKIKNYIEFLNKLIERKAILGNNNKIFNCIIK